MTREEAIAFFKDMNECTYGNLEAVEMAIKALDQEPRWIPVSERLPKPYTYVNATCRSLVDDRANWVVETLYLPIPKENNERGYSDWGDIPMLNWHKAEVVAWMERKIPEPYKGENESKECRGCYYNDGEPHAECVLCTKDVAKEEPTIDEVIAEISKQE